MKLELGDYVLVGALDVGRVVAILDLHFPIYFVEVYGIPRRCYRHELSKIIEVDFNNYYTDIRGNNNGQI